MSQITARLPEEMVNEIDHAARVLHRSRAEIFRKVKRGAQALKWAIFQANIIQIQSVILAQPNWLRLRKVFMTKVDQLDQVWYGES